MKKLILTLATVALTALTPARAQKWEHLADTPQMGWSTWNKFAHHIDEQKIVGVIDAIVESGLRDAGYIYVNIDDCWHGKRDAEGFIHEHLEKFPHGMKWLADYAHSKGLKLGIYTDCGTQTCAGEPGSLGHEYQDALTYARWGIDYLKEDWCNTPNQNPTGAYQLMSDALRAAGRPILLSLCEWGTAKPWRWARDIGHSWRTTGDIGPFFNKDQAKGDQGKRLSVLEIIQRNDTLRAYAGPGHWNDPDMLEVGNGLTENEDRAHFTMWCMMAAPLILGHDVRDMSEATRRIIMNRDMIAIDQDSLGVQGLHYCSEQGLDFWFKPLKGGDWAFTILNPTPQAVTYALNWQDFNLTDEEVSGRSTNFDRTRYTVYNLWTHKREGRTSLKAGTERTLTVPAHDVVAYRLIAPAGQNKR